MHRSEEMERPQGHAERGGCAAAAHQAEHQAVYLGGCGTDSAVMLAQSSVREDNHVYELKASDDEA